MLQGERGQLRSLFSVQQTDALEAWARTLQSGGQDRFLITQSQAQVVAGGYQLLALDWPIIDTSGAWSQAERLLMLPVGSMWDLRLYVTTDTSIVSAQRNELFLADATALVGLAARALDFGYMDRPAGLFSPAFGAARHWVQMPDSPKTLRPVVRFHGSTAVPTIPGQGFTALSGTRIA